MSEGFNSKQWSVNRANFDRNLAVVISIDLYENDSIRDLSTAVSDASAIAPSDLWFNAQRSQLLC